MGIKVEELEERLRAVKLLRALKQARTYRELSEALGLPIPVLYRYVSGRVLPSLERARSVEGLLRSTEPLDVALKRELRLENGFVDNTRLLSSVLLLEQLAEEKAKAWRGLNINKVLTLAVDGVAIATLFALKLGAQLVVAKDMKEPGVRRFYTEEVVFSSGVRKFLHVPYHLLAKGDRVLIVDDMVKRGSQLEALLRIVERARAKVVKCFILLAVGDGYRELERRLGLDVEAFLHIE
ncbi:MAG: adenine phosphoribosyltransferase [Nitrososphaerota archaeon]